jgi:hypothetical protein
MQPHTPAALGFTTGLEAQCGVAAHVQPGAQTPASDHAFRGTNVCTFVPRISSAPFSWGVIASFARVYTSSSAPQCEKKGYPEGVFPTIIFIL